MLKPGVMSIFILAFSSISSALPASPMKSYTKAGVSVFVLSDRPVHYGLSHIMCASYGMVSVSIETVEKDIEVLMLLRSFGVSSAWTSGNDLEIRRQYIWEGTRNPFNYTNWLDGEPHPDESRRCVTVVSGADNSCGNKIKCSGWAVGRCDAPHRALCELPTARRRIPTSELA